MAKEPQLPPQRPIAGQIPTVFTMDLVCCARCGNNHRKLKFTAFHRPPDAETTHYATCPSLKEPILFYQRTARPDADVPIPPPPPPKRYP